MLDLNYPSLRAKPMTNRTEIWEAHATLQVVMTFEFLDTNAIRLRACCRHDVYRNP